MDVRPVKFYPLRQQGILIHLGAILGFTLLVVWLFLLALQAPLGILFLLYLLGALFLAVPIPVLAYRLYALLNSYYELDRNGIRLQWGFRAEDIPMENVVWVRALEDADVTVNLPRFRWPGSVLGSQVQADIGAVEFIASDIENLVLIRTSEKIFAISPEGRNQFLQKFRDKIELGSLAPFPSYSAFPRFLPLDIWRLSTVRIFLIICLVLSIALFIWVGLVVPNLDSVSLRFSPAGEPLPPVSSSQLFLLPVANILLLIASYALSLYFFRRFENHPLIYVLWGSSTFTGLLFLVAVYFILQNS
ncbi:MAG: PH domain-containing protein [Anaerolineales bacterium]|jgi:hypothetical protein